MVVEKGDTVKIHYTGKLDDGTVFDTSKHGDHDHPLEFEAGAGKVIPGFDKAVLGMKKDEEKTVDIKPEEAYGEVRPELTQKVPRDKIPKDLEVKEGMMLGLMGPDGKQYPAKVIKVEDTEVTIDLNHPLAGKTLHFEIKVIDIIPKK